MSPVLLATLACAQTGAAAGEAESIWIERESYLMGTLLRVRVSAAARAAAVGGAEATFAAVGRMEDLLSTWRDDTELARINRSPVGEPIRVPPELVALLREASEWHSATGGAFDPAVGALIDAWDLRDAGRQPSERELDMAWQATGFSQWTVDPEAGTVTRPNAASWLDAGAWGKGAALRSAAQVLLEAGVSNALLDFGGQVLALGTPPEALGWRVAVANPERREEPFTWLRLRDRSAATTAASERWIEVDGTRWGHVLDPRTGRPVPPWGSVTVVAADPLVADVLSTALFVLGPDEGMRWADGRRDVAVLFLVVEEEAVTARWNPPMEQYLENAECSVVRCTPKACSAMQNVERNWTVGGRRCWKTGCSKKPYKIDIGR